MWFTWICDLESCCRRTNVSKCPAVWKRSLTTTTSTSSTTNGSSTSPSSLTLLSVWSSFFGFAALPAAWGTWRSSLRCEGGSRQQKLGLSGSRLERGLAWKTIPENEIKICNILSPHFFPRVRLTDATVWILLSLYAVAGIWTHIRRVAPIRDLFERSSTDWYTVFLPVNLAQTVKRGVCVLKLNWSVIAAVLMKKNISF